MAKPKKTAPYKYNQLEREFDQLRRKNRRRLVIAIVLVMAAAMVLIQVLNQSKTADNAPAIASDEMASTGDHLLDDMLIEDDELSSEQTVGSGLLVASDGNASDIEHAASAAMPRKIEKRPAIAPIQDDNPTPSISVNQKKLTEGKEVNQSQDKANQTQGAAKSSSSVSSTPKNTATQHNQTNQVQNNTAPQRNVTDTPAKKTDTVTPKNNNKTNTNPVEKNTKTAPDNGKLSPQDILNGKTTTPKNTNQKLSPQDILNGKTTGANKKATPNTQQKVVIQVAALSSEAKANEVKTQLALAGISAHLSKSDSGKVVRVRVGPYNDRTQAQKALAIINQQGHQAIIVSQ